MASFAVIIAAAGRSSRFGSQSPHQKKVFRELKGRAIWLRATEAFLNREDVGQILVVVSGDDREWFTQKFNANLAFMNLDIVEGGAERAHSVENALQQLKDDIDHVAIHDAARPLIVKEWIDRIFEAARDHGAAVPAIPISSTVKRVASSAIQETVPRAGLHAAQTPQAFRRELLLEAYAKRGDQNSTDDAQLVEQLGHAVQVVEGSPLNIKITSQDDFRMAGVLLDMLPKEKGLDSLHPFAHDLPKTLFD